MNDKVNAIVYCRNNQYDQLDFYLKVRETSMYLFTSKFYSHNIYNEYFNGKRLDTVFCKTSKIRQQKLKERIFRMANYVAKENGISLSSKSQKNNHNFVLDYDYEIE